MKSVLQAILCGVFLIVSLSITTSATYVLANTNMQSGRYRESTVLKSSYEKLLKEKDSLRNRLYSARRECEYSRHNQMRLSDSLRMLLEMLKNSASCNTAENNYLQDSMRVLLKEIRNRKEEVRALEKRVKQLTVARDSCEQYYEGILKEKDALAELEMERISNSRPSFHIVTLIVLSIVVVLLIVLLVLFQQLKKKYTGATKLAEDACIGVLARLEESALQIESNVQTLQQDLRSLNIQPQMPKTNTYQPQTITTVELSEASEREEENEIRYFLYAETITDNGLFYRVKDSMKNSSKFILEIRDKEDTTALSDLNRTSDYYLRWLNDWQFHLRSGCECEDNMQETPSCSETIEKGTAKLLNGEWHIQTPIRIRLS